MGFGCNQATVLARAISTAIGDRSIPSAFTPSESFNGRGAGASERIDQPVAGVYTEHIRERSNDLRIELPFVLVNAVYVVPGSLASHARATAHAVVNRFGCSQIGHHGASVEPIHSMRVGQSTQRRVILGGNDDQSFSRALLHADPETFGLADRKPLFVRK